MKNSDWLQLRDQSVFAECQFPRRPKCRYEDSDSGKITTLDWNWTPVT